LFQALDDIADLAGSAIFPDDCLIIHDYGNAPGGEQAEARTAIRTKDCYDGQCLVSFAREHDVVKTAVLVEKLGKNKYRASTSQPIALESEGRSRDEAVRRLCTLARKRLAAGEWQQVSLPGPPQANPWIAYAGIWKDHPDFDDFLKNIAEYRRSANGLDAAS
jgi:hypothetical protein